MNIGNGINEGKHVSDRFCVFRMLLGTCALREFCLGMTLRMYVLDF